MKTDLNWLADTGIFVDSAIKSIMSEPVISVPEDEPSRLSWLDRKVKFLDALPNLDLNKIIDEKEPGWQIAAILKLKKSHLINSIAFNYSDSDKRFTIMVEPLVPTRVVQLNTTGGETAEE